MSQSVERRRAWRREYEERNRERIRAQSRARKFRYGRPCLDCGLITDGSNGAEKAPLRCARCHTAARKVWTPEAIIMAIQTFAHRYGTHPGAEDWNTSQLRTRGMQDAIERFYRDGDYPHSTSVQEAFGSWNAAIAAAGFAPRRVGQKKADR